MQQHRAPALAVRAGEAVPQQRGADPANARSGQHTEGADVPGLDASPNSPDADITQVTFNGTAHLPDGVSGDSVQNGNETRIWVLDGVANGLRPWFNKVGASVHDRRGHKIVEDLYVWHWKNERYLRNEEPVARVALVYSQQTTTWYGGPQSRQKVEDYSLGMYHALI